VIAHELGFGDPAKIGDVEKLADRAGKMLWAMREKL
jgi:hypothetical protein